MAKNNNSNSQQQKKRNEKEDIEVDRVKKQKQEQQQQNNNLTVSSVVSDRITQISAQHWLSGDQSATNEYDSQLVHDLLHNDILSSSNNNNDRTLVLLELSHYLENYLWPHFKKIILKQQQSNDKNNNNNSNIDSLIWSIIIMINEKAKEGLSGFNLFNNNDSNDNSNAFKSFFELVIRLQYKSVQTELLHQLVQFLIHCYQSLENPMVRSESLKIVSYPIWMNLSSGRLASEVQDISPVLSKKILAMKKKQQKTPPTPGSNDDIYSNFLINLIKDFNENRLSKINIQDKEQQHLDNQTKVTIRYCELFIEFMIDLVNQITTRRFAFALIDDYHLVVRIRESTFSRSNKNGKANNLNESLKILEFYMNFTIDNFSGQEIPADQVIQQHYFKIQSFQRLLFKEFPELKELALQNVSAVEDKNNLIKQLETVSVERLRELAAKNGWLADNSEDSKSFVIAVIVNSLRKHLYHKDALKSVPFYPNETDLWRNEAGILDNFRGDRSLPLPKLNMQYLSLQDYLFRNYYLFKTEAAYELRMDLEDAIRRLAPKLDDDTKTTCTGWSKMALPIQNFKLSKIGNPLVGESKPSKVIGICNISLANVKQQNVRDEWDSLKDYDVLILISIRAKIGLSGRFDQTKPFVSEYGVVSVRGCELIEICDEKGDRIDNGMVNSSDSASKKPRGNLRQLKVSLDSNQYQLDSDSGNMEQYSTFNIIVRRKAKENNFKAIQETIVSLINGDNNLPEWLSNTFLGYPSDSNSSTNQSNTIDFQDTFISKQHVLDSFTNNNNNNQSIDSTKCIEPPFKVTFINNNNNQEEQKQIIIESYKKQLDLNPTTNRVEEKVRCNKIKFTPAQIDAIKKGTSDGLTLIVGPPGTGKTDVAVQIISNIYHNHPNQRTLIITHSNQALNQLFDKIYQLDIDERHLLRLGHGHRQLESQADFTRTGRIDYMLSLRLHRLALVDYLAKSLGVTADVGNTCETAEHFYRHDIIPRWNAFKQQLAENKSDIKFPFEQYFQTGTTLFANGKVSDHDRETVERCWRTIEQIFSELEECRAFELLKSQHDRFNYLLMKQSRIVAMTCTHAALKRNELVSLGFKYDNVIMEEAGQISDVESFIPLQLQTTATLSEVSSRLKRLVMIGDHHQLPPVVKCQSLVRFSHLDQSLFSRFIRLGIEYVQLDKQGRSRPSLAELFSWRYKNLGNLPMNDMESQEKEADGKQQSDHKRFQLANAGFLYETQLINVDDGSNGQGYGTGESEPFAHFYQNLAEAEYIVAVYQYMRLQGYSSDSISVITTYNGQKELLRNIFQQKCKNNALFGMPKKITTVDKYQGQQNDYILLSLVRTKNYGHIRDLRRLVVATSRARLGLYIFCMRSFFNDCYDTISVFHKYFETPDKLVLVPGEINPTQRKSLDNPYQSLETTLKLEANKNLETFVIENYLHMQQLVQSNLNN